MPQAQTTSQGCSLLPSLAITAGRLREHHAPMQAWGPPAITSTAGKRSWAALAQHRPVPAPGPNCTFPQAPSSPGAAPSTVPQEQRESPACGSAPLAEDKSVHSSQGHPEGRQKADLFSLLNRKIVSLS